MQDKWVQYTRMEQVGIVTMSKPPHNLLEDRLLDELLEAYDMAVDEGCRSIILQSSMRHFCAGAELSSFDDGTSTVHQDSAKWEALMRGLEDVPIPTIASVSGGALGGGLELALTCDFIVAADTAFLGQVEVTVGLLPLLGGTQRLVARCGIARAKEMAMFGRRMSPSMLQQWGIVNLVVPEAELGKATLSWAQQLAAGPFAIRGVKQQANLASRGGVGAADAQQLVINDACWNSADRRHGISAFFATGPASGVYKGN